MKKLLIGLSLCVASNLAHSFPVSYSSPPQFSPLKDSVYDSVGKKMDVDPLVLYSITLVESSKLGTKGNVKPDPFVLRTPTKIYRGDDKKDACTRLNSYLTSSRIVDVGISQVNVKWHSDKFDDPCDLLDVEKNLTVAATILRENHSKISAKSREGIDKVKLIGTYHSWREDLKISYGNKVTRTYDNLRKAGF